MQLNKNRGKNTTSANPCTSIPFSAAEIAFKPTDNITAQYKRAFVRMQHKTKEVMLTKLTSA
jgi:hypothetical protein